MDLAFITKRLDTVGGTERDLHQLAHRLLAQGHSVQVYCYQALTSPPAGLRIHPVPVTGWGRTANLWSLARRGPALAYHGGHDLVISYARVLRQDVARCGGGLHQEFLDQMRTRESGFKRWIRKVDPYHYSLLAIERRQFQRGHYRKIVAISRRVKDGLVTSYRVPESDIEVIYDGIDIDLFSPRLAATQRQAIRRRFGLPLDAPLALFLGNSFKRKGLDTFLAAMARLDRPAVHGLIVGGDPQLQAYLERARKLGVDARVRFAGVQADPQNFYAAADVFVLPSLQEAFGNVVLEAMASGVPVVVSEAAGAAEVLTGALRDFMLRKPGDDAELAALIERMLNSPARPELGQLARRTAEGYSLEAHARQMERHFQEVVAMKNGGRARN